MDEARIRTMRETIKRLTEARLRREKRQKRQNRIPPGFTRDEFVELLNEFDEWCERK